MYLKMKALSLFVFLLPLIHAHAQFYSMSENKTYSTISSSDNVDKPTNASSTTECILKCRNNNNSSLAYFVQETLECFCMVNKTEEIFSSQTDVNGTLYKPEPVSNFFRRRSGVTIRVEISLK